MGVSLSRSGAALSSAGATWRTSFIKVCLGRGIVFTTDSQCCSISVYGTVDPGLDGEEGQGDQREVFHAPQGRTTSWFFTPVEDLSGQC